MRRKPLKTWKIWIFGGCLFLLWFLLGACNASSGSQPEVCIDDASTFETLGIENDDAVWLCDDLPEKPVWVAGATKAVGVQICYAGQDGQIRGDAVYVSPDGDDGNAGDSWQQPLATLTAALCRVSPGQTVYLAPGIYREGVLLALQNAANSPTLRIVGAGESPEDVILDGERWRSYGLYLLESHNVRVENLTVQNYTAAGIQTLLGSGITLERVNIRHNGRCNIDPDAAGEGFGVNLVGTEGVQVIGSWFVDNGPLLEQVACGMVLGTGINTFESSGRIQDNIIQATRGGAMLIEKSQGPFIVADNLVEHNFLLALNNYWDAGLWLDQSTDIYVEGNLFRDNFGGPAIEISDEEHAYPEASRQITLTGNSMSGNLAGVLVWGYGSCPPPEDVISNWETLLSDNVIEAHSWRGEDARLLCYPDFLGGMLP